MKWLHTLSLAIWLRFHPIWGGTDKETLYPTWQAAWATARGLHE